MLIGLVFACPVMSLMVMGSERDAAATRSITTAPPAVSTARKVSVDSTVYGEFEKEIFVGTTGPPPPPPPQPCSTAFWTFVAVIPAVGSNRICRAESRVL